MGKTKVVPSKRPSAGAGDSRIIVVCEELWLRWDRRWTRQTEMDIGLRGEHPPARGALHEALLDEIGLDDFFDRVARLTQRGGDGFDPDRAAIIAFGDQ